MIQIGKVKLPLLSDGTILPIRDPKDSITKSLEVINIFSKATGYKIDTHKSAAFLQISEKDLEREIRETIPFTILLRMYGWNKPTLETGGPLQ